MSNQVFLSYRHESLEHARAVRRLGELLRQAQIPVALDQFYLEEHPGGPDLGWPKWCEDCANDSACVLIIASEGWFAAYDKNVQPGVALGAATEADLFRQTLWDDKGNNARIRVAFLHDFARDKVPVRLRAWHQFWPFAADDQLDQLIRWIAGCLGLQGIEPPTVRWPLPIEFQPDLADRKKEWPAVIDLLAGQSRERILLLEGASNMGKSELMNQTAIYAKKLGLMVVRINFNLSLTDVAGILGQFYLDLGACLPNFSREDGSKTHLLRKDLRALRQPVLLMFDGYNKDVADNKAVADWLNQQLLAEVETALGLAVIVAGQRKPDFANAGWRDMTRYLALEPITRVEEWEPWIARRYPDFQKKGDLRTVLILAGGNPGVVSASCDVLAKR